MASLKDVFKRNFLSVARAQGITSGTALSRLASVNNHKIEKTFCNSMLKDSYEPINLSLEKVEALSTALKVPAYDMLNPSFVYGAKNQTNFDLEILSDSLRLVRNIAEREGIEDIDFECTLASYIYFAKQNEIPEAERYAEVARLTRDFIK